MTNSLIEDIYYKLSNAFDDRFVPENNDILKRIKENIKLYGNTPIDELDPTHSWIKINNPTISSMKFIYTKGYEKHLEKCKYINLKNQEIINEHLKLIAKAGTTSYGAFWPTQELENEPIPWNNYLKMQAYRCVLTNAIGFTYYVKNTYMLKPFHIIKHSWKLTEVLPYGKQYECRNCGIFTIKNRTQMVNELVPQHDFMLSCNEHVIKNLLE